MASIQEPEVQFAQRLASNEKPIRTKAIKKLRKYINVRSQKSTDGFTGDELLKLWKGLFYCLWMQDKPLLQEEISNQISTLIHSFHNIDGQLLYLESFLQTFKREWTGIDRLRMDKFFQLVRFMFRQTFELLKRKKWNSSVVGQFLELLTAQLLQSGSAAPSGLQFHILDLYMTELAAVGSAELSADQNLIFIEPFCKTAAKTKDRVLFRAVCGSIFSNIIDQAPFVIEDLMKEIKAHGDSDSDSGQASEEDNKDQLKEKQSKSLSNKGKQVNGCTSNMDEDDDFGHLKDSDTELSHDEDVGPVLQFDYSALADKLFELSSRSSTPSHNRHKLYRVIKVLRDLSEGIFPQDEYPEEVSTDEDDDMFGSRKRMKRVTHVEEDEEGPPTAKKRKGKKREPSMLSKQNDFVQDDDDDEQANLSTNNEIKKKKRKKKKKAGLSAHNKQKSEKNVQSQVVKTEGDLQAEHSAKEAQSQSSISSIKVTEAATALDHQETPATTEELNQLLKSCINDNKNQSEPASKKRKKSTAEPKLQGPPEVEKEGKRQKAQLETDAEAQITQLICEDITTTTLAKRKRSLKARQANGLTSEDDVLLIQCQDLAGGSTAKPSGPRSSARKKSKKKPIVVDEAHKVVEAEVIAESSQHTSTVLLNEKTKKKGEESEKDMAPLNKKKRTKPKDREKRLFHITLITPAKKKKKSSQSRAIGNETQLQVATSADDEVTLDELDAVPSSKKKRKIPVVFEYEADELEATVQDTAEKQADAQETKLGNDVGGPPTVLSTKKSQKKTKRASGSTADFITFQSNAAVPTPLFCKIKGSPSTPLSSKKKSHTPESKKVTFGLKNNKMAEFRKTDRSLLLSPDGSSRVPFDPKQKPKFGVLKSPPTPYPNRKASSNAAKSTPKRRPSAADFF